VLILGTGAGRAPADDTPRAVIDRAIQAHGGKEKLERYNAVRTTTEGSTRVNGLAATFVTRSAAQYPGQMRNEVTLTVAGVRVTTVQVLDGDRAWVRAMGETQDVNGVTLTELQGSLYAAGVMIFNAPNSNSDTITITGSGTGGTINLSPPTSGLYQGIALFQERTSTNTISVSGNGSTSISGTFYTASGTLNVTGNGGNDVLGSQYISYDLIVGGNGNFAVNWDVNLVARTRKLQLVE